MTAADTVRVFVPRDTAAWSLGADEVAAAIERAAKKSACDIEIVRNGSRGMSWLEPLVEVQVGDDRIAYGPVTASHVPELFAAGFLQGGQHSLMLGKTADIPYLKSQQRWTFRRCGLIDPLSISDYEDNGGFAGWRNVQRCWDFR